MQRLVQVAQGNAWKPVCKPPVPGASWGISELPFKNMLKAMGILSYGNSAGMGVGLKFHEDPFVSHVGRRGTGVLLVPGMVFTIEPMINMGSRKIFIDADNDWTVLTDDGMPSAQWEYTVLITDTGAEIITG